MAVEETFHRSLWSALTPAAPIGPRLEGAGTADVVVVGAGLLGLSLTLHLAEAGVNVALIEADEPGFGASGRNTGFVVPALTGSLGPEEVNGQLGGVAGEKLTRFVGGSGKVVFDTIRRLDIDCSGEQTGWMQPAHTPDTLRIVEARVRHWQALGQPVRLLGKRQTDALTGTDIYSGALIDDSGGQINPLAYARGLARSAVGFGARIFWSSPVTGYARSGNKWHVSTPNGHIDAGHLFLTTNAMRSHPARAVGRSIIPVRPYQVATQPLDQTIRARVLPGRNPVADLHRHTFAYRWSPDNRLITGGIAMCNDAGSVARMSSYFLRRLHRYIPDLPKLEAAFAWSGVVATTPDFMPRIWHVGPQAYAPVGCNGRGVAMTTALGKALAKFIVDERQADLPMAIREPEPRLLHPLLHFGPSVWLGWNRFKDNWDDRRTSSVRKALPSGG